MPVSAAGYRRDLDFALALVAVPRCALRTAHCEMTATARRAAVWRRA